MALFKADIIAQLQQQLRPLGGSLRAGAESMMRVDMGPIDPHFPDKTFPLGAVHEVIPGDPPAGSAFTMSIASALMKQGGVVLWVTNSRKIYPPALKAFGVSPENIIFVEVKRERELLWVAEEALRCASLIAVIAEVNDLSFTASRRLQLAVERSRVTGFILRQSTKLSTTACVTRWRITSLPSVNINGLPGVGHPTWNVELLKIRNGKTGNWHLTWKDGIFTELKTNEVHELKRKAV